MTSTMTSTTTNATTATQARTRRPGLGAVAGVLALAVACSGGAYAAGAKITSSSQIKSGVVNTGDIKNGTIKKADLNKKTVAQINAQAKLEGWRTGQYEGSWATYPGRVPAGFRLDAANGVVHLRGAVTFGADTGSLKTIFELPEGYRPSGNVTISVASTNGFGSLSEFGALEIETDGDVRVYGETDDRFVSLEGVSFSLG